ncbi:hypothetical protein CIB48_g7525 [Xylaria polymorpha]|nr:hypothetical protein CIB48_g7525 [Xylaria polymorpha]
MPLPTGVYRADQVGSLLRPKDLLAARDQAAEGKITAAQLRELEDKYIADVVQKQQGVGLRAVTDGEFRRRWFHVDFLKHLSGIEQRGVLQSTNGQHRGDHAAAARRRRQDRAPGPDPG